MISIQKPEQAPEALTMVQDEIASQLYERKDKFKWRGGHYSKPIREELKKLYHNKCGFCEVKMTTFSVQEQFTIEHYRPKSVYYWLGNEWTNLFPACQKCNNNKKDDFPLFFENQRVKNPPFDESGILNRELCNITNPDFLNEKPLFLHPEIDKPEKYFKFNEFGKAIIQENLSKYEQAQAQKMLVKFINRPLIEEKRKRKIIKYQNRLTNLLKNGLPLLQQNYTENNIKFMFLDFYTDIQEQKKAEAEFSLLGHYMIEDFDNFFLKNIETKFGIEIRKLVEYAYDLCSQQNILKN